MCIKYCWPYTFWRTCKYTNRPHKWWKNSYRSQVINKQWHNHYHTSRHKHCNIFGSKIIKLSCSRYIILNNSTFNIWQICNCIRHSRQYRNQPYKQTVFKWYSITYPHLKCTYRHKCGIIRHISHQRIHGCRYNPGYNLCYA